MVSASLGLVYATELLPTTLLLLSMHSTSCPACMEKTWQTHTDFALVGQSKLQTLQQDAAVQNISPKPLETWSSYRNNFPRESFKSKAAFLLPGGDRLSGRGFQRERGSWSLSRCWGTELGPWTSHEKASAKIHSEEHAFGTCQWTSVNEGGEMESQSLHQLLHPDSERYLGPPWAVPSYRLLEILPFSLGTLPFSPGALAFSLGTEPFWTTQLPPPLQLILSPSFVRNRDHSILTHISCTPSLPKFCCVLWSKEE